jgi:SAM-dependent methyltransferase
MGPTPLAGDYLLKKNIGKEKYYPLRIYFCPKCSLVQVLDVIPPNILFKDYRYLSSVGLKAHFKSYADEMVKKFLKKGDFIVEIGSNDGVLLFPLKKYGMNVLGVDPAKNISQIANTKGLNTLVTYFGENTALKILRKKGKADAIFANNVLAHIDDMHDVFKGINILLKTTGVLVFEIHYLPDLISKLQYDFFYNEHLSYYSLGCLIQFLEKYGLEVFDVKNESSHSGSIRVYVKFRNNNKLKIESSVRKLLSAEKSNGMLDEKNMKIFAIKIRLHKKSLVNVLNGLKKKGERIVGYGASGRGNILLNYCDIDKSYIEYVVDESPERYGRFTPGTHIPIVKPEIFRKDKVKYCLLLAWNYKNMILDKEKSFIEKGGKFIIPFPQIRII